MEGVEAPFYSSQEEGETFTVKQGHFCPVGAVVYFCVFFCHRWNRCLLHLPNAAAAALCALLQACYPALPALASSHPHALAMVAPRRLSPPLSRPCARGKRSS